MCACADRRVALAAVAAAVLRGDGAAATQKLAFVAQSAVVDVKSAVNAARRAAHVRLAR